MVWVDSEEWIRDSRSREISTFLEMKANKKGTLGWCVSRAWGVSLPGSSLRPLVHLSDLYNWQTKLKKKKISVWEKHNISSVVLIPVENTCPESNHEETSDKLKLRDLLKNKWPVHFQNVKVVEN